MLNKLEESCKKRQATRAAKSQIPPPRKISGHDGGGLGTTLSGKSVKSQHKETIPKQAAVKEEVAETESSKEVTEQLEKLKLALGAEAIPEFDFEVEKKEKPV